MHVGKFTQSSRLTRPAVLALVLSGLVAGGAVLAGVTAHSVATEAEEKKPVQILFTNVNILDGFNPKLEEGMSVLVEIN